MKIIESQSAVLTNYEVYHHLEEQRARYKQRKRRGPSNLETVARELLKYLRTQPGPLSQEKITYTPDCISRLLERLRPYDLSKGEVVMILNLRPATIAALNTIIEDMTDRFFDEQQEEILAAISDILGQFVPPAEPQGADADVSMTDATVS